MKSPLIAGSVPQNGLILVSMSQCLIEVSTECRFILR